MGLLTSDELGSLSSESLNLIESLNLLRSTDTHPLPRAHRGVRGALVPGLVTRVARRRSRKPQVMGPGGYHPWSRPEIHRAEHLQVWRRRSDTDSEAKTLAQVKLRSRSRRAAASTTTS